MFQTHKETSPPGAGSDYSKGMDQMKGFRLKATLVASALALVAFAAPAMASAKDVNRDRIPDRWEKANKLSLKVDQRKKDQDTDGLRNRGEWLAGTDPRDADTDGDGVTDVEENAGAISAWDATSGDLTVELYSGGSITATVTEWTRVKCEEVVDPPADPVQGVSRRDDHGHGHGHGDEHGDDDHFQQSACSVDDLAVGVVVHEAEVEFDSTGATFEKIEIVPPAAEPAV